MNPAFLIGRIIFGGFFLYNGVNHFKQREGLAQYTASKGIPQPDLAVQISGAMMAIGGASLMLGLKPKLGTAAIIGFLAGASPLMHDFWTQQDPQQRQNDLIHFSKNIALLGAALALSGVPEPWPLSLPADRLLG